MNKQEAILHIKALIQDYQLSLEDIKEGDVDKKPALSIQEAENKVLTSVLAYIGAIFILAGVLLIYDLCWHILSPVFRILVTLGVGQILFIYGLILALNPSQSHATEAPGKKALPLCAPSFLLASFFIPSGYFVILLEYFNQSHEHHLPCLFVFSATLVQFLIAYAIAQLPSLWFINLMYYGALICVGLDYLDFSYNINGLIVSIMLFIVTLSKKQSLTVHAQAPFWFLMSSTFFYMSAWNIVAHTPFEHIFLLATLFGCYLSIRIQSKMVLMTSMIGLFFYLSDISSTWFEGSLGWPLFLISAGLFFLIISSGILKLLKKHFN